MSSIRTPNSRRVDDRLDEKHIPGSGVLASIMYSGSCVVMPMPWPVRWIKLLAVPASVSPRARRAVDMLLAGRHRRTASTPTCCASRTISCHLARLPRGPLTDTDGATVSEP